MREKLNHFVLELAKKYSTVRHLVSVKDNPGPNCAEKLFENEAETDEDEDVQIQKLKSKRKMSPNLKHDFEPIFAN